MDSSRNISGNVIGDNAVIFQGNFNYNTDSSNLESAFLERISRTDPSYDKRRILDLKGPLLYESFSWILNHDDFSKWRYSKESGVFWIKGDPGKGKTMLLCGIIEGLENIPGINFGYFFCQATDSRINTAQAVVGGLLRFFLERGTKLLELICEKFKDKLDQLSGPNAWEVLRDIFEMVVQDPMLPDPICIVDALDECEHGCKSLLSLIVKTSPRVKWLVSSRNIKDIERKLQSIDPSQRLSLELGGNAFYVSQSVDAYINKSIQDIEALAHNASLRASTANVLKSKANGTYLWVSLVVGQLQNTDQRNVKHILNKMPEGLESLYGLIMTQSYERLGQEDREAYLIILSTITTAKRPLQLEELLTFTKFQWKFSENIYSTRDIQDLVKDCGAFLSIRDNYVYFIHQSAKDYIMDNASKLIFPLGIQFQHARMAQTSLYTLSATLTYDIYNLKAPGTEIKEVSPPCPDPLAPVAYCCEFWVNHLVHSCESNESEPNKSKSEELFKENGIIHSFLKDKFLCWIEALALLRKLTPQGVGAVLKLRTLVGDMAHSKQGSETSRLRVFMDDACRFSLQYEDIVGYRPLQIYYSAMVFDDKDTIIYQTFQQTIRAEFPNAPTITKGPHYPLSLKQVMEFDNRNERLFSLCFSPDSILLGTLSWTSGSPRFSLWRADSGALEQVIEMESDEQCETEYPEKDLECYVAFTPDLKHLVSVSSTGVVQRWVINSGFRIQRYSLPLRTRVYPFEHKYDVEDVQLLDFLEERVIALSQNGDLIASAHRTSSSGIHSVKIWSTKAGDCLFEIEQSVKVKDYVFYTMLSVFSPNSALLALIDESNIRIYCTQTGKEIHRLAEKFEMPLGEGTSSTAKAKFLPDSQSLARVDFHDIDVVQIGTWKTIWHETRDLLDISLIEDFDISPDSTIFLLLTEFYLAMWSIANGTQLLKVSTAESLVAFSPHWPASSFALVSSSSSSIRLWQVYTSNTRATVNELVDPRSVSISPNKKFVAGAGVEQDNLMIWSTDSGKCIKVFESGDHNTQLISPIFSPNSNLLACGDLKSGDVRVWSISTGKCIHISKGSHGALSKAVFSPDSKVIAYIHGDYFRPGNVCVWHISTGKFSRLINGPSGMTAVFSDDSRHLFLRVDEGLSIWVYCMESDQCVYQYTCRKEQCYIHEMIISPGSKYIALALGRDNEVQVWDWRTNHCVYAFKCRSNLAYDGGYDEYEAEDLVFSSDSTVLAAIYSVPGGYEAQIYEIATSRCSAPIAIAKNDWFRGYHKPSFDPVEGCINTFCGTFFRKESYHDPTTLGRTSRPRKGYTIFQITN